MIIPIAEVDLPVGEKLVIKKNRFSPLCPPKGRISIVTGTHGDELEGQYVAFKLAERFNNELDSLAGTVDVYPAVNPLGINSISRMSPNIEIDLNRIFPGNLAGSHSDYIAAKLIEDIAGSTVCIDIHASNIFLREIPQVRINMTDSANNIIPLAVHLGMPFVWVHQSATVLESTLAYSLNDIGVKTLVVEMGVGMRITREYGDRLVNGILSLMSRIGLWKQSPAPLAPPLIGGDIDDTEWKVFFVNSNSSGLFLPDVPHGEIVRQGQKLGVVANPLSGTIEQEVLSPATGLLFTLREYPIVYEGSLLARVLGETEA